MLPHPADMELPDPLAERLLATWPVARLATRRPDGRPHLVPIVFVHHEGALWTPVDAKPKRGGELARVRHVRADPRVCLLLDHYATDWNRLWWLRLEGEASVRNAAEPERDASFRAVAAALREKYPQYRRVAVFQGEPTLLHVRVARRVGWCAGPAVLADLQGA